MRQDEKFLLSHIIEANEVADLKSWIGIGMMRKQKAVFDLIR